MSGEVKGLLNDPIIQSAQLCCECGVCELYACPMGLNPRKINGMLKKELATARIRRQGGGEEPVPSPYQEERKIPTERAAARAGVLKYNGYEIKDLLTVQPDQVSIPLQIHAGPPAIPVVHERDYATDVMADELATGGLTEGAGFDSPLFECDNFIVSPHLGAQTVDAARNIGVYIINKVKTSLNLE